jgi:hypothetical protein
LFVEGLFGALVWSAAATVLAFDEPGLSLTGVFARAGGGAAAGALAGLCGWGLGRRWRWALSLDLVVGGAVVTVFPLAAFGASFGWGYPIAPGVGRMAYLVQAAGVAVLAGVSGAFFGAGLGLLAALLASRVLKRYRQPGGGRTVRSHDSVYPG